MSVYLKNASFQLTHSKSWHMKNRMIYYSNIYGMREVVLVLLYYVKFNFN